MPSPPKPPAEFLPASGDLDPLTREALGWIAYLNSGEEKTEDWDSFEAWRGASRAHESAAQEAIKLWGDLGPTLKRFSRPGPRKITVVAVIAIGLSATGFFGGAFGPPRAFFAEYTSRTGELRSLQLRDGSRVDLDTATAFDTSADGRTLTLHSGQIYIDVQPNPNAPFQVVVQGTTVEALGTAFSVKSLGGAADVVVTHSAVRVSRGTISERVATGQFLTFDPSRIGTPAAIDTEAVTAWRRGELVFKDRPLGEVAREIERYRFGRILILGDELSALPVTGQFDLRDVDTIMAAMRLSLPIRIVSVPGLTIISRDPDRALPGK